MRATPKIKTLIKRFATNTINTNDVYNFFMSYVIDREYQNIYEYLVNDGVFKKVDFFIEYAINTLSEVFVDNSFFESGTPYVYTENINVECYRNFNTNIDVLRIGNPTIINKEHAYVLDTENPFTFVINDDKVYFCIAIRLYNLLMDGYVNKHSFNTIFIKMDDFIDVFEKYMSDVIKMLFIDSGIAFKYKKGMLLNDAGFYLNFLSYTPSVGQLSKYRKNNLTKYHK